MSKDILSNFSAETYAQAMRAQSTEMLRGPFALLLVQAGFLGRLADIAMRVALKRLPSAVSAPVLLGALAKAAALVPPA